MATPILMSASKLIRHDVTNEKGEDLGKIEQFMIDLDCGRIPFVILSFGGHLSMGDKWFAVPWELLCWSDQQQKFILNTTEEALKKSPSLDKGRWHELVDERWLAELYACYGCIPYW